MDALDELVAKEAIRQQLCNYGRGVDRRDKALLRSVWHDDGTLDYSLPGVTTPDQLIEVLWSTDVTTDVWLHPLTAIAIQVQGDRAASEAYVSARSYRSTSKTQVQETLIHARYLDGWSKRNGRWAIDHRKAITDIRITRQIEGEVWRSQGRPDKSDPSYGVFEALREGRPFG